MLDFLVEKYDHGAERNVHHIVDSEASVKGHPSLVFVHPFR